MKTREQTSRYISLILRHRPDVIGITLDEHGWADVKELIAGVSRTHPLDLEELREIVRTDEKGRYAFSEDGSKIRATQGHSVNVDVELRQLDPPEHLWHGSASKYEDSIDREGLLPKSRLYVHLSQDVETARKVGSRHGSPVIYRVDAARMAQDGYAFYLSQNNVWLTKHVPVLYLHKMSDVGK